MEHSLPRTFIIGLIIAAAFLVLVGEKASAQDYTSFFSSYLSSGYAVPAYSARAPAYTPPPAFHYTQPSWAYSSYGYPYYPPVPEPTRRYRSPFGPLPPRICGTDPWITRGIGIAGEDLPVQICVL